MKIFRTIEDTPSVYSEQSRDFQLLCRLQDSIFNGVKFDTDTMKYLLDTKNCRASMLQLLQTKLGFFTEYQFNDDSLRYILEAFPIILKNKGSLKAIEQAINVFLKVNDLNTSVKVWYLTRATVLNNRRIPDRTIVVEMESFVRDTSVLQEIFKYILPSGFNFYFYFSRDVDGMIDTHETEDNMKLLFASANVNSTLVGAGDSEDFDYSYKMNSDTKKLINTINGMELFRDTFSYSTQFLGIFEALPSSATSGDMCIIQNSTTNGITYYYDTSWKSMKFRGAYSSTSEVSSPSLYDIIAIENRNQYYVCLSQTTTGYTWGKCTYMGEYDALPYTQFNQYDLITVNSIYYVNTVSASSPIWKQVKLEGSYSNLDDVVNPKRIDEEVPSIAILNNIKFYIYTGSTWDENSQVLYMLRNLSRGDDDE